MLLKIWSRDHRSTNRLLWIHNEKKLLSECKSTMSLSTKFSSVGFFFFFGNKTFLISVSALIYILVQAPYLFFKNHTNCSWVGTLSTTVDSVVDWVFDVFPRNSAENQGVIDNIQIIEALKKQQWWVHKPL